MFKYLSSLVATAAVLCSVSVKAEVTVGGGYQYGGVVGVKYAKTTGDHIAFASIGLIGGAVGYQYILTADRKHTMGVAVGSEIITSEKGFAALTYNYYSQGADKSGWTWGGSLGARREDNGIFFSDSGKRETKTLIGLHLGYRF
ncbi:hypothetical protein [Pseudoalteromonas piscicida]|uniref:Outer membrane protein beta-barrel domain-containing protein n=1 Tax=Pseudoalteromonas piscicida TaxID=43662 RepID=A0A2A5JUN6_PSEO7|nr:hypothetical protein [Pseudoalteromonas piscicida]PCK33067.1 hypothetical protein CEX98_03965 [Pseudoalteromonas piscicida]